MSKTKINPLDVIGAPQAADFSASLEVLDDSDFSENAEVEPDVGQIRDREKLDGGPRPAQAPLDELPSSFPSKTAEMSLSPPIQKNDPQFISSFEQAPLPGMPLDAARVFAGETADQAKQDDVNGNLLSETAQARDRQRLELDAVAWTTVVSRIAAASRLSRAEVQAHFLALASHLEACNLASLAALPGTILTLESVLSLLGAARNLAATAPEITGVSSQALLSAFQSWQRAPDTRPPERDRAPAPKATARAASPVLAPAPSPGRGRPPLSEEQKRARDNAAVMAAEAKRLESETLKVNAQKRKDLEAQRKDLRRKFEILGEGESKEEKALSARLNKQLLALEREIHALGKNPK